MAPSLLHPVALAAIALLVVNDHVLKARFPGFVTGKLSDVAGVVFFPLLLDALVAPLPGLRSAPPRRRLVACVIATAVVFALVKTWAPATHAYEVALGWLQWPFFAGFAWISGAPVPAARSVVLVRDPTDLAALPFVATALVLGRSPSGAVDEGLME